MTNVGERQVQLEIEAQRRKPDDDIICEDVTYGNHKWFLQERTRIMKKTVEKKRRH